MPPRRTRRILEEAGVDAKALSLLYERDMKDLGIRRGAMCKLRKYANDLRTVDDDPPEFLTCPLSLELYVDPVLLVVDGGTYERKDISAWIDQHGTSPLTRVHAKPTDLVPNRAILDAADAFRAGWGN